MLAETNHTRPSRDYPTVVLSRRYGVTSSRLISWELAGWVEPTTPRQGSGRPLTWAPWAQRMVGLLAAELVEQRRTAEPIGRVRSAMLRELAQAVRAAPEAPWYADTGRGWVPCSTPEEAVERAALLPCGARRLAAPPPPVG